MEQIKFVENELINRTEHPNFSSGDTVTVHYKIKEGNKERTQLLRELFCKDEVKKELKHLLFVKFLAVLV